MKLLKLLIAVPVGLLAVIVIGLWVAIGITLSLILDLVTFLRERCWQFRRNSV
jgi:hypothetical protein